MSDVHIVIPSAGRADDVKVIPQVLDPDMAVLCVPESEEAEYRRHNPGVEIVAHPDSVRGLPPKRQWIYDKFGDVMMLDDDLVVCYHFEHASGTCTVGPQETYDLIQRLADNARDMGIYLFGFSPYPDIRAYTDHAPFKVTGFVIGGTLGILKGSKLSFSSEVVAGDDYWISALNAYHHRMALIDLRYKITSKSNTFHGKGGTSMLRTTSTEARDTEVLRRYFGSDVVKTKKRTFLSKGKAHGHEHQRTLVLPF